ncbi:MAG TPA: hypothetical protein VGN79_04135 [Devosia sp.]|nr:hypothetical protein [Devosia sp.]
MRVTAFFASLAILPFLATATFAQSEEAVFEQIEELHGMAEEFGEAFGQLQDAFLFEDPESFASLAAYPLEVAANGELYDILEPEDLVENFDYLMTDETQAAIGGQDFADLIVTSEGVGFADGALWMTLICSDDSCEDAEWAIIRITN